MRPTVTLLTNESVNQIIEEGFALLEDPGIELHNQEAIELLLSAGAKADPDSHIVRIPERVARKALKSCPKTFSLYNLSGDPIVKYGGKEVHFDPGSAALTILDRESQRAREADTADFVHFIKLVEMLPQLDAQSTAIVCSDVPEEIGDLYRLYLALCYMSKPIVTGAFRIDTWGIMKDLLVIASGGLDNLQKKPLAIFDVCPSPPLKWSDLTCQNLIDSARHQIPSELVSMPLTGATSPVTLAGAVVQHTAECLSGITICQLAQEGAPIVWGGSPSAFDMKRGTTPMGAVGTWMIDIAYTQIGQALEMPTHSYLGMSDAKVVDTQCGLESAGGTILAALAGVNMVSGAGMMAFENCQSFEKLVIDAEIISMAKHLIQGIQIREDPIALNLIREVGHKSDFISHDHTNRWFREELCFLSPVIDRQNPEMWELNGALTCWDRAKEQVDKLVAGYKEPTLDKGIREELRRMTTSAAQTFGMDQLPPLPE